MDPQRWREVRALFDELVELDPAPRSKRIAEIADRELRAEIESLLVADKESDDRIGDLDPPFRLVAGESDLSAAFSDPLSLTGRTLAHFKVLGPLDSGGMGVVYRAEDTRLHRTVALKLLLPRFHLDPSAKARFLHEARSAAALDHPNICTVYEVGESEEGLLFLAMALYSGDTLKSRLARTGAEPVHQVLEIAQQIASGLACAHAAGIVHRDLKPGNLMLLPNGTVKILDFGLAKPRELSPDESGATLGTVAYMAPEQIRGEETDERTDLWALGVVLYEMLTGQRPFRGEQEQSIADAILRRDPVRPRELRTEIPPAVEALVLALLQKDPAERPPTAEALREPLAAAEAETARLAGGWRMPRRPAIRGLSGMRRMRALAGGMVLTSCLVWAGWQMPERGREDVPPARSVAVLPFENRSDEKDANEYLAVGLHDEVITQLAKVANLKVIARTSMRGYAGTSKPPHQVAEELGVQAVVMGTVQRVGERLHVNAQLVDARTNETLWENSYDRNVTGLFAIRTEIVRAIINDLELQLPASEYAALDGAPTSSARAYQLYLEGRQFQGRSTREADLLAAESRYRLALELDPQFALAHAHLSNVHAVLHNQWYHEARREQWRVEAETALRLQPDLPEAHVALALYWFWAHGDHERALSELAIARSGMPGAAGPLHMMAAVHWAQGRAKESLEESLQAIDLDPLNPVYRQRLALNYTYRKDYSRAVEAYDRAIELAPDDYRLLLDKGMVFLQWKGTTDSLAAALNRLPPDWDVDGEATLYRVLLARLRGRPEEALTALDRSRYSVLRLSGKIVTPYAPTALLRAQIYDDLLGDSIRASEAYEAARAHLERAVSESREDPRLRIALGEAYAGLGRKSEAEHEAREAERLVPISRNLGQGASYVEGAARIFARVGEKDAALERLEQLVGLSYGVAVSRPRLRIDPTWDVLRDEPRFERLLQGGG